MSRPGLAALLACLVGLGGCTIWPPPGQGGFAELRPPASSPQASAAAYDRLATLTHELDGLRESAAGRLHPAQMATADRLVLRIRRGLAGGLVEDAEADLRRLQSTLDTLAAQAAGSAGTLRAGQAPAGAEGGSA